MKRNSFSMLIALSVLFLGGCFSGPYKPYKPGVDPVPEKYAELRLSDTDKVQVLISYDIWRGWVGPDGFGGYKHIIEYWATLTGTGPVYSNPDLLYNAGYQSRNVGTITLDRANNRAIFNFQQIVSQPGEPQQTISSPANGNYPIKAVTRAPFLTPEIFQDNTAFK